MKIEEFEQLKSKSLGHSLIKAGRLYNEYSFGVLREIVGDSRLKPSHMQLFPVIPYEGISIAELAKKLEISKQAVSVLVNDMLDMKVLQKFDNPNDKRSFLIKFEMKKNSNLLKGMNLLSRLDSELITLLGKKKVKEVNQALLEIIDTISSREK
jgi:DNA-binding MarR family transcriptional regulator